MATSLNKLNKKERNESKTDVIKKTTNPTWVHEIQMYVFHNVYNFLLESLFVNSNEIRFA